MLKVEMKLEARTGNPGKRKTLSVKDVMESEEKRIQAFQTKMLSIVCLLKPFLWPTQSLTGSSYVDPESSASIIKHQPRRGTGSHSAREGLAIDSTPPKIYVRGSGLVAGGQRQSEAATSNQFPKGFACILSQTELRQPHGLKSQGALRE